MKAKILLGILVILTTISSALAIERYMLEVGPAEWEKYALDEEANKDKLYCRVTEDQYGKVTETRWYNYFINPNEVVRVDSGDTRTLNCESPNFEPVYAKGSNEGKVYSKVNRNQAGEIIETIWYDACTNEIVKTDKEDTTYPGSGSFTGKCYHPDFVIEESKEKTAEEDIEKEIMESPIISFGQKIVNWFKKLFGM